MPEVVTIGDATLYCGDCLEILPTLPKVDAVITDPPYGIGAAARQFKNGTRRDNGLYGLDWDATPPDAALIEAVRHAAPAVVLWGGNYFSLPPSRCWLVWDKCTGENSYADAELAWTNLDSVVKLRRVSWVGNNAKDTPERLHPTQKPERIMSWCIDLVGVGGRTILDPFMGSGTTGVAALQLGRKFIGIELEPRYFDIACKRIEQAHAQGHLFEPASPTQPSQTALL